MCHGAFYKYRINTATDFYNKKVFVDLSNNYFVKDFAMENQGQSAALCDTITTNSEIQNEQYVLPMFKIEVKEEWIDEEEATCDDYKVLCIPVFLKLFSNKCATHFGKNLTINHSIV